MTSIGTRRRDPLGLHTPLPLKATHYPLGFRLDITTNSRDVLEAAVESWPGFALEHDAAPFTMRVVVSPDGPLSQMAAHRMAGHLYAVVSDPANFGHIDFRAQFADVHVSQATASDHSWLRWFFIESLAYLMLCQRHVVMVHAGCVVRDGRGILLCGASASGKSTLSYACARAGWSFLSDDCTCLLPDSPDRIALGRSTRARFRLDAPQLFPELDAFTARARPTGKIGIEVPMSEVPGITTTRRAPIATIVFLERRPGPPTVDPIPPAEAVDRLLADMPSYGDETDAIHDRVLRRLTEAPAYRARYETIDAGIDLIGRL